MKVNTNTIMLSVVALGLVLVVGLIVLPAIDEAHARNAIASERNKGQRGFEQGRGHLHT